MVIGVGIAVVLVVLSIACLMRGGQKASQATAVVSASAVIAAAVFSAIITQGQIKEREIAESHRVQKIVVYDDFAELYLELLQTTKYARDPQQLAKAQQEVVDHMFQFSKRAMLWASPEVLLAWNRFRSANEPSSSNEEVVFRADDVLQAMRTDLGLSNHGLERGDLVKMYISDPQNLRSQAKGPAN